MIETIIIISSLVYLFFAGINDIRKRFVHDYMTYSFGALFLLLRILLYFENSSLSGLLNILYVAAPTLLISYVLYKTGAWGGGDLKLLTAMAIGSPFFSTDSNFLFFVNFLTNTLVCGMFFGLLWSLILIIKNIKKVSKKIKAYDLIIIILFFAAAVYLLLGPIFYKIFSVILFFMPLTYLAKKVEYETSVIEKSVKNLEEGDWILSDIKLKGAVVKKKPTGLSKEDIKLLQSTRLKSNKIKDGIPFVPSFFLGYASALIYGNIIFGIMSSLITSI